MNLELNSIKGLKSVIENTQKQVKKLEEAIKLKDDEIRDIHSLMEIKNKSNKDHFSDVRKTLDKYYQQSKERLMSHQALAQKVNEM